MKEFTRLEASLIWVLVNVTSEEDDDPAAIFELLAELFVELIE